MKTLLATVVGTASLLTTGVSLAQNGNMMNSGMGGGGWMSGYGGMMGGYGGMWVPTLLVIVVVGLVAWVVTRNRK